MLWIYVLWEAHALYKLCVIVTDCAALRSGFTFCEKCMRCVSCVWMQQIVQHHPLVVRFVRSACIVWVTCVDATDCAALCSGFTFCEERMHCVGYVCGCN